MASADLDASRVFKACDATIAEIEALPSVVVQPGTIFESSAADPRSRHLPTLRAIRLLAACAGRAVNGGGTLHLTDDEVGLFAAHFLRL